MSYFAFESHCSPLVARRMLATLLKRGELALFLGAGVSLDNGIPDWRGLVANCESVLGVAGIGGDDEPALLARANAVRAAVSNERFFGIVHEALYGAYGGADSYPDGVLTNPMLIAIGALVMSSSRGSASDVITLNFDDLLEWYLHLHGFVTQVVAEPATLHSAAVDVRVHHLHGSVPLTPVGRRSSWLVFTEDEFRARLKEAESSPWSTLMAEQFMTKTVLFIGTSMSDRDVGAVLETASLQLGGDRPVVYVLLVDPKDGLVQRLKAVNAVPVVLPTYESVPSFLLEVCRGAAALR